MVLLMLAAWVGSEWLGGPMVAVGDEQLKQVRAS